MAEGKRKNFDIQNNDFGWAHQPFSFLKNTVFLILTAMLKISTSSF